MANSPKSVAVASRTRPADAENPARQNKKVLKRAIKTEPPAPIDIAEETKDRILP